MALHHLIYLSTATREPSEAELDAILGACARHNPQAGVTGMLLYAGGTYIQVLEGEHEAVRETFMRIARDPRHCDATVLEDEAIAERSFPAFHMGFRRLEASDAVSHPAWAPALDRGFDLASLGARPGIALELLVAFGRDAKVT